MGWINFAPDLFMCDSMELHACIWLGRRVWKGGVYSIYISVFLTSAEKRDVVRLAQDSCPKSLPSLIAEVTTQNTK
jgi:hypothetical protein